MLIRTLTLSILIFSSAAFAQSGPRAIHFNIQDSNVWSQELKKMDFSTVKDAAGNKFELMQFASADHAFGIRCTRSLASPNVNAACLIVTDNTRSDGKATQVETTYDGLVQTVFFKNRQDVAKLNSLVSGAYDKTYKTTETKSVTADGPTLQLPLLEASCSSARACQITMVNGSN
jgi:hypothetical protein